MMQHRPTRVLCLCTDDFGLHEGIDKAVLRLLDMGRIQAIGCMVGGWSWQQGAAQLQAFGRDGVDLGLHLDLTERPLLPGSKHQLSHLILSSMARVVNRQALRQEIEAQLDAFEDGIGRAPTYVDGHQHVHQLPVVRGELLSALTARYGQALPWLRSTRRVRSLPRPSRKAAIIERLGDSGLQRMARVQGFRHNTHLLGVYDFRGGSTRYMALLGDWLHVAASGDLLMCHPGLGSAIHDDLSSARQAEFDVLSSDAFDELIRREGLTLQPLSSLWRGS